jgi:predicted AAA+ superfamily ATPase
MKRFLDNEFNHTIMLAIEQLKAILVDQKASLMSRPPGIRRGALERIKEKMGHPHVLVLTGIRRCGKSTLLKQVADEITGTNGFHYVNFEDERLFKFPAERFNDIYEALVQLYGPGKVLLLDEVQNVTHWETFVRRFQDQGIKIIITGSNTHILESELGTKLTGRHLDIDLTPFTFREYLAFRGISFSREDLYLTEKRASISSAFEDYLISGGMPEYLRTNDNEVLKQTYGDIVVKDIIARHALDNPTALRELYLFLLSNVGNRNSMNTLMKIVGLGSVNTVKDYLSFMEETFLGSIVLKYDPSPKKRLANGKKIYIADNGFIRILSLKTTPDYGTLLENLVFNILRSRYNVYYHSEKGECDFAAFEGIRPVGAIQVTYILDQSNRDREINGLLEAMDSLGLSEGTILTISQEEEISIEGKRINIIPVWKWILTSE